MIRFAPMLAAGVVLISSVAFAQDEGERARKGPREDGREATLGEMLDFEVVSIDRQSLLVTARDVAGEDQFRFRLPANSFVGQTFSVDAGVASVGKRIAVRGRRDAKLERLVLEEPLGLGRSDGGNAPRDLGRPDYSIKRPGGQRPGSTDYSPKPPVASDYGKRPVGAGGGAGKTTDYRVESFDTGEWIVTARAEDGSTLRLQVDPEAFVGYRFQAPVRSMRRGEGFTMLAINQEPIENCCTVIDGGGR